MVRHLVTVALALFLAMTAASAQELTAADTHALFPGRSFLSFDVAGSFRARAELWQDVHMGLSPVPNKYGVYPQLSGPDGVRESSDFRFRLAPTLHIGEMAEVFAVVDLFNTMAGEGGYSPLALTLKGMDQVAVPGSLDSPLESAYVRAMWAQVHLFHVITFQAGRIPEHWGMGLVENDGRGLDADGGDYIDGVSLKSTNLPLGMEASLSWDFALQGRQVESAFGPWGVGYDPGDWDDIQQWRLKFKIAPGPNSDGNYWAAGTYQRIRMQDFSSLGSQSPYQECQLYPWAPGFGCNEMFWRDAFIWTPDVWFESGITLAPGILWRVELEVAARYGSISNSRFVPDEMKRTLMGIGGALRSDIKTDRLVAGIEVGAASGDADSVAFGILDAPVLGDSDSPAGGQGTALQDSSLTSFGLHPGHFVDQILFRRVIGAVTNAYYVKPSAHYEFWQRGPSALWVDVAALYGGAFVAGATPGDAGPLGIETNLGVGARFDRHVTVRLDGALLVPLAGLKDGSSLSDPMPWTARLLMDFAF